MAKTPKIMSPKSLGGGLEQVSVVQVFPSSRVYAIPEMEKQAQEFLVEYLGLRTPGQIVITDAQFKVLKSTKPNPKAPVTVVIIRWIVCDYPD